MAEALKCQRSSEIFAIILDRKLPDGTAEEYLPELRKLSPSAAVIIVTGYADIDGAIAALREGAADYVLKPIKPESLRARLRQLAQHWQTWQELKEAREQALQSERLAAIGQMMAGLAHESRNALQRSQACLEMLVLEIQDRPQALDFAARIQKAQDDLYQLYEEVRGYAAPIKFRFELTDLRAILIETWEHLDVARQGRNISFQVIETLCDLRCEGDPRALGQVFRNILENSLAACSDPVEIQIAWSEVELRGRPAIQISAWDNGPGLNPVQRQRIFEPFYTTKTHGTGLGMAIVQRIVEGHGGRITVGTSRNSGTEMLMTLPRKVELKGNP
ncbi:MAG: kinE 1 [Planctomycetaceae bacterium]|nr:kinE 1 [Planctomycetaceae bacterium]